MEKFQNTLHAIKPIMTDLISILHANIEQIVVGVFVALVTTILGLIFRKSDCNHGL